MIATLGFDHWKCRWECRLRSRRRVPIRNAGAILWIVHVTDFIVSQHPFLFVALVRSKSTV